MLAKIVALSLVILAASPFTAPFSTCNLLEQHNHPARRQTGDIAVAAQGDEIAFAVGTNDTIALAADPPADVRSDDDAGNRLLPLPAVTGTSTTRAGVSPALVAPTRAADWQRSQAPILPMTVLRL